MSAHGAGVAKPTEILNALKGRVEPPPVSGAYKLGLLVVATAMILLPLVYVGLIGLAAWGTWWHSVHNVTMLAGRGGVRVRLFLYATPIAAGCTLVLFMLKPLFSKPAHAHEPRLLQKKDEPLLFSFIERLCRVVGSPVPDRIAVDTMINASAGHMGMVSLRGSTLVLTIGLPLVAGLTLRQFTGVLAHEFGHFGQAAGMRVSQLIRRVNHWFSRVVEERDEWDERLVEWSEKQGGGVALAGWVARFFVWLSRRVLWALMLLGHAISCYLMQQMEFDADVYEARVAGGDAFAATALRLRVLVTASQAAYQELSQSWLERRLAEDLPALIVAKGDSLPAEAVRQLEREAREQKTQVFDTHPSDRDRIERARAEGRAGLFRLELPASVLFRDFGGLCRSVTLEHYRELTGHKVTEQNLVPNAELLGQSDAMLEAARVKDAFFGGLLSSARPFFLGAPALTPGAPEIEELRAARAQFETTLPAARLAVAQLEKTEPLLLGALQAQHLLGAGMQIEAKVFHLPTPSLEGVAKARERAARLRQAQETSLLAAEQALRARLLLSLRGLRRPEIREAVGDAVAPDESERLLPALHALEELHPLLNQLREGLIALQCLLANIEGRQADDKIGNAIGSALASVQSGYEAIGARLGDTRYPFEHADGEVTLAVYLRARDEEQNDPSAAAALVERYYVLLDRIQGRLAVIAQHVEAVALHS